MKAEIETQLAQVLAVVYSYYWLDPAIVFLYTAIIPPDETLFQTFFKDPRRAQGAGDTGGH